MSAQKNKEIIRRFFNILNSRDPRNLEEVCDENMAYRTSAGDEYLGLDAFRELMNESYQAFSDVEMSIEALASEGDRVVCLYRMSGVNDGEFQGMPPSKKRVDLLINSYCTIENERIAEVFEFFDFLTFLQQVGVVSREVHPGGEEWPRDGEKLRLYS